MTSEATTTFFYDDWNLIEERVAYTNGSTSTIRYYWGKDLSGTLQGAGGVGGLLYLIVNGTIYIPCYDHNGNITRYLDASGNTVAQYTYDAFGNCISNVGPPADFFRRRSCLLISRVARRAFEGKNSGVLTDGCCCGIITSRFNECLWAKKGERHGH